MKKRSKRLLATALAAAMSCSMVTGWANTAVIDSITVTPDGGTAADYTNAETFSVSSSDVVTVKVKIMDATPAAIAAAEATFLSYVNVASNNGATLDNTTIQYVDQQTTAADVVEEGEEPGDAYATFTFRPRMSSEALMLTGAHTARVGGTSVETPQEFSYTVAEAVKDLNLSVSNPSVTAGDTVTFTVTSTDGIPSAITVTGLPEGYESNYDSTTGQFTWVAVEGSYSVVISADGYEEVTAVAITVAAADEEELAPEDATDVKEQLDKIVIEANPTSNTVSLGTTTVTGADGKTEYNVNYDVVATSPDVTYSNGVITYTDNPTADITRVAVTATVGTTDNGAQGKTSYIYFVKDDVTLGFGNVFGITSTEGKDIFADDNTLKNNANHNDMAMAKTLALSVALGKADKSTLAKADETLNWNRDDKIVLAEYYILKRMLEADENEMTYIPSVVNGNTRPARPAAAE